MLGKNNLQEIYFNTIAHNPKLKDINNFDTLLVKTYQTLDDIYGNNISKDDAKEIALCIWHKYGFLYR
jgi:hypothetical protein